MPVRSSSWPGRGWAVAMKRQVAGGGGSLEAGGAPGVLSISWRAVPELECALHHARYALLAKKEGNNKFVSFNI
jgi:hypothetical protein